MTDFDVCVSGFVTYIWELIQVEVSTAFETTGHISLTLKAPKYFLINHGNQKGFFNLKLS